MIKKYENYLIINGKSKNTITNYIAKVKDLLNEIKLENINKETLYTYFLQFKIANTPVNTVNNRKKAIRSFLQFLGKDKSLVPRSETIPERLPEFITEEYLEKNIIPVIECISKNVIKRKAILYFMFYTGLRVGEIPLLKRKNIDLNTRIFKFYIPKGKKEKWDIKLNIKANERMNISILLGLRYLSTIKKIIINNIEPNILFIKTVGSFVNNRIFNESIIIEINIKVKENQFI